MWLQMSAASLILSLIHRYYFYRFTNDLLIYVLGLPVGSTCNVSSAKVIAQSPKFLSALNSVLGNLNDSMVINYMRWRALSQFAPSMSQSYINTLLAFYQVH